MNVVRLSHQKQWVLDTKYLVFSGGGVRGLSYLGIIDVLDKLFTSRGKSLFDQIDGYAGSSAGALFSMLLCIGCRDEILWDEVINSEMEYVIEDIDFIHLWHQWGLNAKQRVNTRIRAILERHIGNPDITFKELQEKTGKILIVTASCVNDAAVEYHSAQSTPDYLVWKSVSASMSIPIIFAPEQIGERYYCDGGFLDNLPMVYPPNLTLAFLLTSGHRNVEIHSFKTYMQKILYMTMDVIDKMRMSSVPVEYRNRVVQIITPEGINSWDFILTTDQKNRIARSGVRAMLNWLDPTVLEHQIAEFILHSLTILLSPKEEIITDDVSDVAVVSEEPTITTNATMTTATEVETLASEDLKDSKATVGVEKETVKTIVTIVPTATETGGTDDIENTEDTHTPESSETLETQEVEGV